MPSRQAGPDTAAVGAPLVSCTSLFGTGDGSYLTDALAREPWGEGDHLRAQSPLTCSAQVSTPAFLHGDEGDVRCPGGSHLPLLPIAGPLYQDIDRSRRILSFFARRGGGRCPAER